MFPTCRLARREALQQQNKPCMSANSSYDQRTEPGRHRQRQAFPCCDKYRELWVERVQIRHRAPARQTELVGERGWVEPQLHLNAYDPVPILLRPKSKTR